MAIKTVADITRRFLIKNGYDGLCRDGCGCEVEDLMPCDEYCGNCTPSFKHYDLRPGHEREFIMSEKSESLTDEELAGLGK